MIVPTITCDECGKARGIANRWWVADVSGTQLPTELLRPSITVMPFHCATEADLNQGKHFCGHGCLFNFQQRWMSEVTGAVEQHAEMVRNSQ